jgi:hypothetical protein
VLRSGVLAWCDVVGRHRARARRGRARVWSSRMRGVGHPVRGFRRAGRRTWAAVVDRCCCTTLIRLGRRIPDPGRAPARQAGGVWSETRDCQGFERTPGRAGAAELIERSDRRGRPEFLLPGRQKAGQLPETGGRAATMRLRAGHRPRTGATGAPGRGSRVLAFDATDPAARPSRRSSGTRPCQPPPAANAPGAPRRCAPTPPRARTRGPRRRRARTRSRGGRGSRAHVRALGRRPGGRRACRAGARAPRRARPRWSARRAWLR